jgi:hypothetical protein
VQFVSICFIFFIENVFNLIKFANDYQYNNFYINNLNIFKLH